MTPPPQTSNTRPSGPTGPTRPGLAPRLTVGQVANHYGVSNETVRRWIRSGKLTAERSPGGKDYRIPVAVLEADSEAVA